MASALAIAWLQHSGRPLSWRSRNTTLGVAGACSCAEAGIPPSDTTRSPWTIGVSTRADVRRPLSPGGSRRVRAGRRRSCGRSTQAPRGRQCRRLQQGRKQQSQDRCRASSRRRHAAGTAEASTFRSWRRSREPARLGLCQRRTRPHPERSPRLLRMRMNAHDVDAFVSLFAGDYDSRQPVHPDRAFKAETRSARTGLLCSRASLISARSSLARPSRATRCGVSGVGRAPPTRTAVAWKWRAWSSLACEADGSRGRGCTLSLSSRAARGSTRRSERCPGATDRGRDSSPGSDWGMGFSDDARERSRSRSDACFGLAERASEEAGPAGLVFVPRWRRGKVFEAPARMRAGAALECRSVIVHTWVTIPTT